MKKLLLIGLLAGGLAFVPVQRSDAQIFIGIPGILGIGTGPGAYYGYPYFEYGYYPYGGITTGHPTMGITEDRHTIGITGIECITVTTVIIITIAIGATRGTRGTRTNNKTVPVDAMRVSNPDRSPLGIDG
jgi:hypothetical protein